MASTILEKLTLGVKLREQGRLDESRSLLLELTQASPEDPQLNYQCAWAHDVMGMEREAIPFYERALEKGLAGKNKEGALVGLGSSYRCVGEYRKASDTLRRAAAEFPSNKAIQAFLAMALHSQGEHNEAVSILLRDLAETSSDQDIREYKRAIQFYAGEFDKQRAMASSQADATWVIDDFERSWGFARHMTLQFIKVVPRERWDWSPHPRFAAVAKQVRHLVCVHGVYNDGFLTGQVDFSRKHSHYLGGLDKASLTHALEEKSAKTKAILRSLRERGTQDFRMDFCGSPMGFAEYCDVMLQHEAIHHGQWSFYAALGGFETPPDWKLNWDL